MCYSNKAVSILKKFAKNASANNTRHACNIIMLDAYE